ncbi:MAG: DMT family transporter [Rhodobacterales bacterium]|jgi:drug/metabolite transporter (DMT)-like permease|nr:DMT family transporter [Rhodobacter sp.]HBN30639.1 EamA family transporter [Paracoccaceae bacterium]
MANLRGIGLMVFAMALFALADMFIKHTGGVIPVGEILLFLGAGGAVIFGVWASIIGEKVFARDIYSPLILLRNAGEITGTFGFVTAITLTPISSASAIFQASPLAVTLGAALFMQEKVGWRRWSAIAVGFIGVLIIIRPGLDGFQAASLFAVLAVIGLSIRDLATRAAPKGMSSVRLGTYGFAALVPAGALLLWLNGPATLPNPTQALQLSAALVLDVIGYYALTRAMRMGDVSIVTSFRYTRIIFAMFVGVFVFKEALDIWIVLGTCIIIASGLYTFARERHRFASA